MALQIVAGQCVSELVCFFLKSCRNVIKIFVY